MVFLKSKIKVFLDQLLNIKRLLCLHACGLLTCRSKQPISAMKTYDVSAMDMNKARVQSHRRTAEGGATAQSRNYGLSPLTDAATVIKTSAAVIFKRFTPTANQRVARTLSPCGRPISVAAFFVVAGDMRILLLLCGDSAVEEPDGDRLGLKVHGSRSEATFRFFSFVFDFKAAARRV